MTDFKMQRVFEACLNDRARVDADVKEIRDGLIQAFAAELRPIVAAILASTNGGPFIQFGVSTMRFPGEDEPSMVISGYTPSLRYEVRFKPMDAKHENQAG